MATMKPMMSAKFGALQHKIIGGGIRQLLGNAARESRRPWDRSFADGSRRRGVSRDVGVSAKSLILLEELGPHAVTDSTLLALHPLGCMVMGW